MNHYGLIAICLVGSFLSAGLAGALQTEAPPTEKPAACDAHVELAALRSELDSLSREISKPSLAIPSSASASRVSEAVASQGESVADVVRRLVNEEALRAAPQELQAWPGGATNAQEAILAILDAGLDSGTASELWSEAAEQGRLHELLAAMEEHMESVPESAQKHVDRARSYYAAARAHPSNADGNWWVDSNNAYSKALESDPGHWEARYQKARNMSFWPVAYGGQAEAIRHFEILREQQGSDGSNPRHAQTYLWLGNLYDQQGKQDQAQAVWSEGLGLFPSNSSLSQKLDSLGG